MREIKFRAWDKIDKRLIIDKQDFIPLIVTNKGVFKLDPTCEYDRWIEIDKNRFDFMQYTELKDKNGVEIYKSDLLKDDKGRIFKVIEDNRIGATGYIMECVKNKSEKDHIKIGNIYNFYSWITPFHCLEVIGNIYETHELLN